MDECQLNDLLQSIAISSGLSSPTTAISQADRIIAFNVLERFKRYDHKSSEGLSAARRVVAVSIELLSRSSHSLCLGDTNKITDIHGGSSTSNSNTMIDITTPTKLYALGCIMDFVATRFYTDSLADIDRAALRQSVLAAAKQLIITEPPSPDGRRIVASKIANVLANFAIRDFPQRWMTFASEVLASTHSGGLWNTVDGEGIGTKMCLECLSIIIENCTDSDFNSKISTTRRNDVLTGLNEVSAQILQPMLSLMGEEYAILVSTRQTLFQMDDYLMKNGRSRNQMTEGERTQYSMEQKRHEGASNLIVQSLITMEKFCRYMPIEWAVATDRGYDFISVFLHLLREPSLQVYSIYCLEAIAGRKLDFGPWFTLIAKLPQAVTEANNQAALLNRANNSLSNTASSSHALLVSQLPFHRELSKMLSLLLSAHVAHITNDKDIIQGQGDKFHSFTVFMRLLVDMLSHPSGRVCGEQTNLWLSFLRDPQIASTSTTISPFFREVLLAFMAHTVRVRWSDVEDGIHPFSALLEGSWDVAEEYELWLMELRSKTSFLFKSIAHYDPLLAASTINAKILELIATRGNGEPRDHTDPSSGRLTEISESYIEFEGIQPAFDNILHGIPEWALMEIGPASVGGRSVEKTTEIRNTVRLHLSQLASAIVSWTPVDVLLRLRRVALLQTLRYFWKHDPTTLAAGIDALLIYLGAIDDWTGATGATYSQDQGKFSEEVTTLRNRSGCALISISKEIPTLLLPWLSQLSDRARTLLSSENILHSNRMHLYEFLSCVATAIDDSKLRAKFVADVLFDALNVLDSPIAREATSSVEGFMNFLGVTEAGINVDSVTNPEYVNITTQNFARFFSAFNQLLSVGRRCHEAAKMRPNGGIPLLQDQQLNPFPGQLQHFPDEGPVSIDILSNDDPFVPLWPKFLHVFLRTIEVLLRMWHPEYQAKYLCNNMQRFVYSISDDEVYLSRKQDQTNGGVFGEGGTAGSVVSGWCRKDRNLIPRWSGWLNELRNSCFQLLGLLASQRVLYAPEMSSSFPGIVAVLGDADHLRAMEHRHMTHYIKQFVEVLLLSCPSTLYPCHVSPLLGPLFEHMQYRLQLTWAPILNAVADRNLTLLTAPLNASTCAAASSLAAKKDGNWYATFYARGGLFVGDLEAVSAESVVEKVRVDLTRGYCDMLQSALALRGEWGLVLANQAKEEQAAKRNDPSKLVSAPRCQINLGNGERRNADGTVRTVNQSAVEARQLLRINGLCHFLLLEDERIAGNLVLSVIQCLGFPDAYTCRRCTRICHRILETVAWEERYTNLIGQQMFSQVLALIVKEPKWMIGIEWNMMAVARDIYCRLVLGQYLQAGGQGSAMQQPTVDKSSMQPQFEQSKHVNAPLQGGGILCKPSELPQQILAQLPGMTPTEVLTLNAKLSASLTVKDQKEVLREFLRVSAENLQQSETSEDGLALFGRAVTEESVLSQKVRAAAVPDLPEKLYTASQALKKAEKQHSLSDEHSDSFASDLFQQEDNR